jgi:uncharacterized integral membrane protein (TIGR00698 family)
MNADREFGVAANERAGSSGAIASSISRFLPGLAASLVVALAAKFLEGLGLGPALILALACGLFLNPLTTNGAAQPGIQFGTHHVLAAGVALLGARLTFADIAGLGWETAIMVTAAMAVVMIASWFVAKALGLSTRLAVLAGCGTAICGASAAVAAASVFTKDKDLERDTALVVITTVVVSAMAMLGYPVIAKLMNLTDLQAGVFFGGSIHNVPQAVGAGYAFSEGAGDVATLTKLYRVSLLAPIVVGISLLIGAGGSPSMRKIGIPWFVVVFAIFVAIGSLFPIPVAIRHVVVETSNWLLLIAMAAIGMTTSFSQFMTVGGKIVALVVMNSVVLAGILLVAAKALI